MKRILIILIIFMFSFASYVVAAQKEHKLLDVLSFYNKFYVNAASIANPLSDASQDGPAVSSVTVGDEFKCEVSLPIAELDNVNIVLDFCDKFITSLDTDPAPGSGLPLAIGFSNAFEFSPSFTIAEIYTLALPVNDTAAFSINTGIESNVLSVAIKNKIAIKDMLDININFSYDTTWVPAAFVDLTLTPKLLLSSPGHDEDDGSIDYEDLGIGWQLKQSFAMLLAPENYKDTDPGNGVEEGLLDTVTSTTDGRFIFNFLKLAGVEDIELQLWLEQNLTVTMPYCYNLEEAKTITTSGLYGLKFCIKGFTAGLFMILDTQDWYYAEGPIDNHEAFIGAKGIPLKNYYHPAGRGQIGPKISLSYGNDWLDIGISYVGKAQMRDFDKEEDDFESLYPGTIVPWENIVDACVKFMW